MCANGKSAPTPKIAEAFASLSGRVERLESSFSKNHEAYADSFLVTEGQTAVMQKALSDLMNNRLRITERAGESGRVEYYVDFQTYLFEYCFCQVFADFVHWLGKLNPRRSRIVTEDTDEEIVFGGPP